MGDYVRERVKRVCNEDIVRIMKELNARQESGKEKEIKRGEERQKERQRERGRRRRRREIEKDQTGGKKDV